MFAAPAGASRRSLQHADTTAALRSQPPFQPQKLEAGNELLGQGELVTSYGNILKGVVKLSKMMSDGRQQIVGLQFAPDFLGRPFLAESKMTAEAATDVEICLFPRRVVDRMVSEVPDMERKATTSP